MNIRLQESTFKLLITVLCKIRRVGQAIEIFDCMVQCGYMADPKICSLLLSSLCKARLTEEGMDVINFLSELRKLGFCPGISDYKKVIRYFVKQCMVSKALDMLYHMKSEGIKPDVGCYTMVLSGAVEIGDFTKAENLFDEMLLGGLLPSISTYNVYIEGLCKQNKIQEGLKMISNMELLGSTPNSITYNTLLSWFCKKGEIAKAKDLAKKMESKHINRNTEFYRIMADGLLEIGEVDEAYALLDEVWQRDVLTSGSPIDEIILLLSRRGFSAKAYEFLEKTTAKNVFPRSKGWEAVVLSSGVDTNLEEKLKLCLDLAR